MSIVLAIDDQQDNLITIKAVLKSLLPQTEVITATSGLEGIKIAKEKNPSVILLDIVMPLMDGYETCRVLKSTKATSNIPIVMITATSTDSNSKVKALELGADAFITKPIEPVELVAQLRVVLRTQEAEARLRAERNKLDEMVKQRTNELESSRERYKTLHNNAPLPFQSLDTNGIIIEINPAWLQTLGYKRDEVIGKWYGDFLHKDYVDAFVKNFPILKKKGRVKNVPFKLRTKNGDYIEIRLDGTSAYDSGGKFLQTYCTYKNVTEEQKQQQKLEESEKKYRSFVEQFQGIAFLGYGDFSIDFFEGNVKNMTGYSEDDFIKKKINYLEIVHPEDVSYFVDSVNRFMSSKQKSSSREYRIVTRNGDVRWIYESISKIKKGNRTGVYGTLQDISELKRTESRLTESQKMAKVGSFDWDTISNKAFWSDEVFSIFGLEKGKQPGFYEFKTYIHPENRSKFSNEEIAKILNQPFYEVQYSIIDQTTKEKKHIQVWGKSDLNKNGEVVRTRGTIQDITKIKEAENKLKKAKEKAQESDRLKSAFLANMSHEIRTPMNGIMGFLDLLKTTDLNLSEREQYIDIIQASGNRLLNTINDIIEISKIEAGENIYNPESKNLIAVCKHFIDFFERETRNKNLNLVFENGLNCEEYQITTDFNKLESIISNLIKNAIKFTSSGEIKLGVKHKNNKILFHVSDTGMGIPANRIDAIFDRFIQANLSITRGYEGSGLGLSICKAYSKMLKGEIWVESTEDIGSTFFFTVTPEEGSKTVDKLKTITKQSFNLHNSNTIIIAEDDDVSFLLMESYLKGQNLKILRAFDGTEVLDLLQKNDEVTAILMDIKMPNLDGLETTRLVRQLYGYKLPVIAQTAFALPHDRDLALESGCNDFITKPISKAKFVSILDKYLS